MIKTTDVDPRALKHLPTANPNVMEPQVFEALVKAIKEHGFLQPILVVEEADDYVLVDGVHRSKAAVKVGLATIPAVVAESRQHAEILRIAMNKMRGELDLSEVGRQLQLMLDIGFDVAELELTGFAEWEIKALLDAQSIEDELEGADVTMPEPDKPKSYNITVKFTTETARARVKQALEELGDGDVLAGLESALDAASPDWRDA